MDVYEDEHGITLRADLPGGTNDSLNIQVNNDSLLLEGEACIDMPEGMEALYADIRSTHYRRSFNLSREFDVDQIEADLKNGVLTLTIPKRAEVRPRKIEVRTD